MNLIQLLNDPSFDEICIPRLQRDYAQGRRTVKIDDIRNTLLSEIFSGKRVHLNMIFGDVDVKNLDEDVKSIDVEKGSLNKCRRFIPIDGQQRLTTLFLLYLYRHKMYQREQNDSILKRFTYETRRSSTDFIKQLVENEWPVKIKSGCFSQTIRNENWYRSVWDNDPTVTGMLVMLDDIHDHASELRGVTSFPDLDKITFDFENLQELGLNETLYIKMNSRGLELNNFEIVKCSIETSLPDSHIQEERECFKSYIYEDNIKSIRNETFAYQWKWCIDRKWSDWFWNPIKLEGDGNFLKFLTIYSISFYAAHGKDNQASKVDRYKEVKKRLNEHTLSWEHMFKGIESNKILYFTRLAKLLNRIILTDGNFKSAWGDTYTFKDIPDMEYKTLAVLFALACYDGDVFCGKDFEEWMRVCFNLIEYIDSAEAFITFCGQIKNLTDISTDILNGLQLYDSSSERLLQEKIKASLLLRGVEQIREAEHHKLFRGNIRQLLVDENNSFIGIFNNLKWLNFKKYFNNDGTFLDDFETDFVVAFLKSCNQENQLNNDEEIFNFSPENIRIRLTRQRYVSVFHNILVSASLQDVQPSKIANSEEWNQYRDAIAYKEVISAILNRSRSLQFGRKGMEFLFRKGSWLSSNNYIALDYTLQDGSKRYRNSFLDDIGYDGDRVADNHNLWWAADVHFEIKGQKYEWNVWNWIYPLNSKGNRFKYADGKDVCLNAYSVNKDDLIAELTKLISAEQVG